MIKFVVEGCCWCHITIFSINSIFMININQIIIHDAFYFELTLNLQLSETRY